MDQLDNVWIYFGFFAVNLIGVEIFKRDIKWWNCPWIILKSLLGFCWVIGTTTKINCNQSDCQQSSVSNTYWWRSECLSYSSTSSSYSITLDISSLIYKNQSIDLTFKNPWENIFLIKIISMYSIPRLF